MQAAGNLLPPACTPGSNTSFENSFARCLCALSLRSLFARYFSPCTAARCGLRLPIEQCARDRHESAFSTSSVHFPACCFICALAAGCRHPCSRINPSAPRSHYTGCSLRLLSSVPAEHVLRAVHARMPIHGTRRMQPLGARSPWSNPFLQALVRNQPLIS